MDIYTLPFSAQEIEEKLNKVDDIENISTQQNNILNNMSATNHSIELLSAQYDNLLIAQSSLQASINEINDAINLDHSKYFTFENGFLVLQPQYRGIGKDSISSSQSDQNGREGSQNHTLPQHLIIPQIVNGVEVTKLAEGAFYGNTRILTLTLPNTVKVLPQYLCCGAYNLKAIYNTTQITEVGQGCITYSNISFLNLPNLNKCAKMAFLRAFYLRYINIGNTIQELPSKLFYDCYSLFAIEGGAAVTTIGPQCFYATRNLKYLSLLSNNHLTLGLQAFFGSRIQFDWASRDSSADGAYATPVVDNTTDYWSGVTTSAVENKLVTKLGQLGPGYNQMPIGQTGLQYNTGCSYFASMHIDSAFTGIKYNSLADFIQKIESAGLSKYLENDYQISKFVNAKPFLKQWFGEDRVQCLHEPDATPQITSVDYTNMLNALNKGALLYITCSRSDYQYNAEKQEDRGDSNKGHIVVVYGINAYGEMLVLDSSVGALDYPVEYVADELYTYAMPIQNFTGPSFGCIAIYPPKGVDA